MLHHHHSYCLLRVTKTNKIWQYINEQNNKNEQKTKRNKRWKKICEWLRPIGQTQTCHRCVGLILFLIHVTNSSLIFCCIIVNISNHMNHSNISHFHVSHWPKKFLEDHIRIVIVTLTCNASARANNGASNFIKHVNCAQFFCIVLQVQHCRLKWFKLIGVTVLVGWKWFIVKLAPYTTSMLKSRT